MKFNSYYTIPEYLYHEHFVSSYHEKAGNISLFQKELNNTYKTHFTMEEKINY